MSPSMVAELSATFSLTMMSVSFPSRRSSFDVLPFGDRRCRLDVREVLEADEATEAFSALRHFQVGVERVEDSRFSSVNPTPLSSTSKARISAGRRPSPFGHRADADGDFAVRPPGASIDWSALTTTSTIGEYTVVFARMFSTVRLMFTLLILKLDPQR